MSAKLDEIDWDALGAPEIPILLRRMQSPKDKHDFSEAYNHLTNIVFPEGISDSQDWGGPGGMMQTEAPLLVIPFLTEMLSREIDSWRKLSILELLHSLAAYWELRTWITEANPKRVVYEQWARRINDAVRDGALIYQELLKNPLLRNSAQEVLDILDESRP